MSKELRKRLLRWHYNKQKSIKIYDLLDSNYQSFRRAVERRLNEQNLDFREAIKQANEDELYKLQRTIDEERLGL